MRPLVIVETKKAYDNPRRRWIIQLPNAVEDRRQVVAYNCFFCGRRQYNWRDKKKDYILYSAKDEIEMKIQKESYKHNGISDPDLKPVPLKSIWEFFEVVGFDYKSKKWIKKEPRDDA